MVSLLILEVSILLKNGQFCPDQISKRLISQVMISADKGNVASRKTIEANGGILENTVEIDGDEICRYWINLEKSME